MAKIKIYLRKKSTNEWFKDLANIVNLGGTWKSSPDGFVWTHSQYNCKVRFLMQYDGDADFVKVWHPSRKWFDQARAVGTFVQWIYDNAYDYVRRIESQSKDFFFYFKTNNVIF